MKAALPKKQLCGRCRARPRKKHFNSKWCEKCAQELIHRPAGKMTKEQIAEAKSLVGTMPRDEIAETLGVSLANLRRSLRGVRLVYHNHLVRRPELVKQVCAYYEKHGKKKTQERFPGENIRSIVERYKYYKPRQIRWTNEQIHDLVKMGGIIPYQFQWKYFKRPNAREGSIRSFWMKRMGLSGGAIHGMSEWVAREIVNSDCPFIKTGFWESRRKQNGKNVVFSRKLFLWVDMENNLKKETPGFIKDAISSMAQFQRWVFSNKDPKKEIVKMIHQRTARE